MTDINILGDTYLDIQTGPLDEMPVWGEDSKVPNIEFLVGGSACNTARYLAVLGKKPTLYSCIGDCKKSMFVSDVLNKENLIDIKDSVKVLTGQSCPCAIILYGKMGRGFISTRGCLEIYTANYVNRRYLENNSHLHLSGYFAMPGIQNQDLIELLEYAKEKEITISMDCQYDGSKEWTGKNGNLAKVLPYLSVFMPSEDEAFGIAKLDKEELKNKEESLSKAFKHLRTTMPKGLIIIKCGKKGVRYTLNGDKEKQIGVEEVPETDSTGAGDSFNAGFLYKMEEDGGLKMLNSFLNDESGISETDLREKIEEALLFGCELGSRCVQKKGAFVREICDEAKSVHKYYY